MTMFTEELIKKHIAAFGSKLEKSIKQIVYGNSPQYIKDLIELPPRSRAAIFESIYNVECYKKENGNIETWFPKGTTEYDNAQRLEYIKNRDYIDLYFKIEQKSACVSKLRKDGTQRFEFKNIKPFYCDVIIFTFIHSDSIVTKWMTSAQVQWIIDNCKLKLYENGYLLGFSGDYKYILGREELDADYELVEKMTTLHDCEFNLIEEMLCEAHAQGCSSKFEDMLEKSKSAIQRIVKQVA